MNKTTHPSKISGTVSIPGSKSHTIRALLIASMAEGTSIIERPLYSSDTLSCIDACRKLGAQIKKEESRLTVTGNGGKIAYDGTAIDVGNSGTTLYLAAAIAALSDQKIEFTGDHQIQRRTAAALLDTLIDLGVEVESNEGCAPFTVRGPITGGSSSLECPTSQYLSALLMAAPLAQGTTELEIPLLNEQPYVEMTLQWLAQQNIKLENDNFKKFTIPGGQQFHAINRPVPADFSSASFFLCAAAVTGSTLRLEGLDMNDSQGDKEIIPILQRMGCTVEIESDAVVISGGNLKGCEIDLNDMPDALPILAVTAACAEGTTRLMNVAHARLKETDRVAVMAHELRKLGIQTEEHEDGLSITGGKIQSGSVEGHHDHRIVMAFSIAALAAEGPVTVSTADAAAVTFPNFFELLEKISDN